MEDWKVIDSDVDSPDSPINFKTGDRVVMTGKVIADITVDGGQLLLHSSESKGQLTVLNGGSVILDDHNHLGDVVLVGTASLRGDGRDGGYVDGGVSFAQPDNPQSTTISFDGRLRFRDQESSTFSGGLSIGNSPRLHVRSGTHTSWNSYVRTLLGTTVQFSVCSLCRN